LLRVWIYDRTATGWVIDIEFMGFVPELSDCKPEDGIVEN